jgi:hypothetical protein
MWRAHRYAKVLCLLASTNGAAIVAAEHYYRSAFQRGAEEALAAHKEVVAVNECVDALHNTLLACRRPCRQLVLREWVDDGCDGAPYVLALSAHERAEGKFAALLPPHYQLPFTRRQRAIYYG